ncbi:HPr kinase/phosphorylase [soil metagenome]
MTDSRGITETLILHASLAAVHLGERGWRGVLLVGPSGAGKSDLALRLVQAGWRLVADDRVIAWPSSERAYGRAPTSLRGLMELRGQGVAKGTVRPFASIDLVANLGHPLERQPQARFHTVAGLEVPLIDVAPFEASAPERLRRALSQDVTAL